MERVYKKLSIKTKTKMVLLVIDGLGGLPSPETGLTELETAHIPNLDALAKRSVCGRLLPVLPGITPGSGPAHLGLFGYDPLEHMLGRGILAAVGIGFKVDPSDLTARLNFATMDAEGIITDRRAGRIPTEVNKRLCEKLRGMEIPGVKLFVETIKEHRAVVIFRGEGLSDKLSDTDPQHTELKAHTSISLVEEARHSEKTVNRFVTLANKILKDETPANTVMLRGFSKYPDIETLPELYKLTPAAIALYPMYRGIASLIGMELLEISGNTLAHEFDALAEYYRNSDYDYLFVHIKPCDSAGEDGNFQKKVEVLEEVDRLLPKLTCLKPDVLAVTGDHSTPSNMKSHSWHPVPVLLSAENCLPDRVNAFHERSVISGGLGEMQSKYLLALMLANAGKLEKYGA